MMCIYVSIILFSYLLKAIIFVSKNYSFQEFSDGSFEKPYTNLTFALNISKLKNESQIILREKDIYDDLYQDIYLLMPLEINCSTETEFATIKLNAGTIQIINQVFFEGIIFTRRKIHQNHHAFIVNENANLIFKVIFCFVYLICI